MQTEIVSEIFDPAMLYTRGEASKILKVTPRALRYWVAAGKLRSFTVGRLVRFTGRDLAALLQPNERTSN